MPVTYKSAPAVANKQQLTGSSPVSVLKRVGPRVAEVLSKLGIYTLQDLLFHLPLRYQDRTRVVPIAYLKAGKEAVVEAEVLHSSINYGRRRSLVTRLSDGTGTIDLRFFHFSASQKAALAAGSRLRCFGEVRRYKQHLEMVHPEYRHVKQEANNVAEHLTAIYPATEGLGQLSLRSMIDQCVDGSEGLNLQVSEWLPKALLQQLQYPDLQSALAYVHKPPPDADTHLLEQGLHPCQQRLAFEELLAHYLSLRKLRLQQKTLQSPKLQAPGDLESQLIQNLPFKLTAAQQRVVQELLFDLEQPHPTQRLVQGDVGSGKTVVAAITVLRAVEAGYQVAIMAPTEILAEQHRHNLSVWLQPLNVTMAWLSGKTKGKARKQTLESISTAAAQVVVGTHALFQDDVEFKHLGLVVIDEQHRFGVHQRLALRNKGRKSGYHPHQIIMTATPIPRTLAMTAYADLDCSVIDELPPGRKPVETVVMSNQRRDDVISRVYQACANGRQTYWVCTLIEESEVLQCQAAQDTAENLGQEFSDLRVGLIHGRLPAAAKEEVMSQFKRGEIDLLVATTVIEVGVDVPNASLMIIENAERLGLSQLHQLRGRVGRGDQSSVCVLMYQHPLSNNAKARLSTMRDSNDGFEIARMDLKLRGPGEVLGTRQTGVMQYRIVDLQRDQHLLAKVQTSANRLFRENPEAVDHLIQRWLGQQIQYGDV